MNRKIKNSLFIINGLILALSGFWFYSDGGYEPMIVLLGQFATLLILFFEGKSKSTDVERIDHRSKVKIRSKKEDTTQISVKDVKNESEVDIKRN